jgi:CRP-like cAMP-binding protein
LLSSQPSIGSVIADSDSRALFLPAAEFERIVDADPRYLQPFAALLAERFAFADQELAPAIRADHRPLQDQFLQRGRQTAEPLALLQQRDVRRMHRPLMDHGFARIVANWTTSARQAENNRALAPAARP